MAERVGFEPTVPFGCTRFPSVTLGTEAGIVDAELANPLNRVADVVDQHAARRAVPLGKVGNVVNCCQLDRILKVRVSVDGTCRRTSHLGMPAAAEAPNRGRIPRPDARIREPYRGDSATFGMLVARERGSGGTGRRTSLRGWQNEMGLIV